MDYKRCLIRKDPDGSYGLSGVVRRFGSLRELLGTYQHCSLQADGVAMRLAECCPPRPKGTVKPGTLRPPSCPMAGTVCRGPRELCPA